MKRFISILMVTAAIALVPARSMAQKENPRGVYKLMTVTDKYGNPIKEPFDQYKICTDSVTLMFTVQGNQYSLGKNDKEIFNYTGTILGEALADFTNFSSPEAFVLFGGLTKSGDLIMNPVKEAFERNVLGIYKGKVKILISELKESDAAVLGASALGWEIKE